MIDILFLLIFFINAGIAYCIYRVALEVTDPGELDTSLLLDKESESDGPYSFMLEDYNQSYIDSHNRTKEASKLISLLFGVGTLVIPVIGAAISLIAIKLLEMGIENIKNNRYE